MDALGHTWNISSLSELVTVIRIMPAVSMPPYSFRLIVDRAVDENLVGPLNSTLSLTVFAGFNGTVITCLDANLPPGVGDKQSTIAMVFGEYNRCNFA